MNWLQHIKDLMPLAALVGTYMLILAHNRSSLAERVKKRGIETEGTVTEIHIDKNGRESPVVYLVTQWGSYQHHAMSYAAPCPYKVGQKVKVWYYFRKSNREATLEDEGPGNLPATLYRWGIVLILLGAPFLIKKLMLLR